MQTPLATAFLFLYVLCGVTILGLLILFGLKLRNIAVEKRTKDCLEKYQDYFVYLQAHGEEEERLKVPYGNVTIGEKQIIQKKLFELMERFTGVHRQKLGWLCEDLGLVDLDLQRLNSAWKWTRVDAAYNLGVMRSRRAVPGLLQLLEKLDYDPSLFIVARAVAKCARNGNDLGEMVRQLVRHRKNCHPLIVDIISETEVETEPLYVALLQEADRDLVEIGLIGLSVHHQSNLEPYLHKLVNAKEKEVRIKAVKLLCKDSRLLTDKRVREFIIHNDWEIRAAVAKAIGSLGLAVYIPILKKAVSDPNWWVCHHSARSLAQLGIEGFQALCEILQENRYGSNVQLAHQVVQEELEKGKKQQDDQEMQLHYNQKLYLYQSSRRKAISTVQA
ncbi:HEAT repeat domain-containing protein [Brevibacillus choshinensis]|uniref:HEAT repeat domain-containing protein n=1 Tax=Brevibacillus choshinensis TaxID=54911 RepID=A0ABX7FT79_BRECH|nr:HEAT repeat domain-containing protein [Brevibacillus choshinensis]QRG68924.1 HEAT repeat domain-containing protein [Brevibacillus choshinensis]